MTKNGMVLQAVLLVSRKRIHDNKLVVFEPEPDVRIARGTRAQRLKRRRERGRTPGAGSARRAGGAAWHTDTPGETTGSSTPRVATRCSGA